MKKQIHLHVGWPVVLQLLETWLKKVAATEIAVGQYYTGNKQINKKKDVCIWISEVSM